MQNSKLVRWVYILLLLVLIIVILVYAKPFLVPLTFAAILAMLLLPIAWWLEEKRVNKAIATLCALLVFVVALGIIIAFLSWQVSDIAKDAPNIEQQLTQKVTQVQTYITQSLGIPPQKQQQILQQQQSAAPGKISSLITGVLTGLGTFLANFLLVLV
ncbi:MAG: AI-2E family transporter, partial [Flavisolibacter sp.]|nr:AI-2E family transporter [Flavisolibacter sp.]